MIFICYELLTILSPTTFLGAVSLCYRVITCSDKAFSAFLTLHNQSPAFAFDIDLTTTFVYVPKMK